MAETLALVLFPGLLAFMVLCAAFAVVVLLPVLAVTVAAALLAAVPVGVWPMARRPRGHA